MADPLSIILGTVTLAGVGIKMVDGAREIGAEIRDARDHMIHTKIQHEMLRENLANASSHIQDAAVLSLAGIESRYPKDLRPDSKKARLGWTVKHKRKVAGLAGQLKEIESSTTLSLQLKLS